MSDPAPENAPPSVVGALKAQLAAISEMDAPALRAEWRRLYRSHPPKLLRRDLLELGVAWKLQERVLGGLSVATKRQLTELARTMAKKSDIENAADLAQRWPALPASGKRAILHVLIAQIDVRAETVDIAVRPAVLPAVVKPDLDARRLPEKPEGAIQVLSVPARLRRTGMETKLLIQGALGAEAPRRSDRSLQRLIAQAQRFNELITAGAGLTITELATQAGVSRSYFSRVLRLSFLAPEITRAIVLGRQPSEFSAIKLIVAGQFACVWPDQRRQLGFE